MKTVLCSGGFDPIHSGHLHYLLGAVIYGKVIVALNSDDWLRRKKGYCFQPWWDRANIVRSIKNVDEAVPVDDHDDTVCAALRAILPDYFANGGDRHDRQRCAAFTAEHSVCKELGIEELFGVGGRTKMQSSSKLVEAVR